MATIKKLTEHLDAIARRLKLDKKLLIILAIGFAGMAFLLLSELWSGKDKSADTENAKSVQTADSVNYSEDLERRLTDIISSINGAGKTKVMVTLENGLESVYADRETIRNGKTAAGSADRNESYESDREYIIIQTDEGGEGGLVIKVIQPRVRGVAIVCQGGDSAVVRQQIAETVSAVLDISSARIYISKSAY